LTASATHQVWSPSYRRGACLTASATHQVWSPSYRRGACLTASATHQVWSPSYRGCKVGGEIGSRVGHAPSSSESNDTLYLRRHLVSGPSHMRITRCSLSEGGRALLARGARRAAVALGVAGRARQCRLPVEALHQSVEGICESHHLRLVTLGVTPMIQMRRSTPWVVV
jgi:hypothetical protein